MSDASGVHTVTLPDYVQHVSGKGKKWRVLNVPYNTDLPEKRSWCVEEPEAGGIGIDRHHFLPKSEYVPCPPPRRRVTGEWRVEQDRSISHLLHDGHCSFMLWKPLRWRLVTREDLAPGEVCIIVIEEGE